MFFGLVWYSWLGLAWFGCFNFEKRQFLNISQRLGFSLLKGPKVCGGVNGGSAGARISRPIIVIRLESKLINKTKVILLEFVWPLLNMPNYVFGLVWYSWLGLVWFGCFKF